MPARTPPGSLVLGTRGSDLALTQANMVRAALAAVGVVVRLQVVRTQGDQRPQETFDKLEGKGFFTSELEAALVAGTIDAAVHSLKDLPTMDAAGLRTAAVTRREDASDVLVVRRGHAQPTASALPLPPGSRVGTSSVRRRRLLESLRPDLVVLPIRGNVGTRLGRLDTGEVDAVVLAQAGLSRLALDVGEAEAFVLPPPVFVPAPGQGALGVQCRADDGAVTAALGHLHDPETAAACAAEREVLRRLGGGCHAPLGAYAHRDAGGSWRLDVFWQADAGRPAERLVVLGDHPGHLVGEALARLAPSLARP